MTRWNLTKWTLAFVATVSLLSWSYSTGWCAARHGQVPLELRQSYPPPGIFGFCCPPNIPNWGHYRTTWRQWPGEKHPAQDTPLELGREVIPTPVPQKPEPLEKYVIPHEPQQTQEYYPPQDTQESVFPPSQTMPSQQPMIPSQPLIPLVPEEPAQQQPETGKIIPPEGLLIPKRPPEESLGTPKPEKPSQPPSNETLPGLPGLTPEPETPAPTNEANRASKIQTQELPLLRLAETKSQPVVNRPTESAQAAVFVEGQGSVAASQSTAQTSHEKDACVRLGEMQSRYGSQVEPAGYVMAESSPSTDIQQTTMPSVALDGYCPVALGVHGRWTLGNLRWTVVHKGWIYRLSGDDQRRKFLEDPDRFAPAFSCNDPVLLADQRRAVPGQVSFCAQYDGRIYMFTGEATQAKFNENPGHYAVTE